MSRKYATLVSGDGLEFTLLTEACLVSPMLKAALQGEFSEGARGRVDLPEIR